MTGGAKRCKQGLVKFALSLHKLVTGTLIKGKCLDVIVFVQVQICLFVKFPALKVVLSVCAATALGYL